MSILPWRRKNQPTTFERAASAGVAVSVVSGAEFTGSGLTRAVLRGARYVGVHGLGDLAACVGEAVADGGFCYGYHSELDLLGHLYGPGSKAWRLQLRQGDQVMRVQRTRLRRNRPYMLERVALPASRFPGLAERKVVNDQIVFGHTGGAAGETTYIGIYQDLDWVAVILSNYDISNQVGSLIQLQDQLITQHAAS